MTAEPTIRTLNDLLDAAARARPRPGTLATPQMRLSYGDLRDQVLRTAAGMHAAGIGRGDRVAIVLRNGIPFVVSYFALARLGAVAVPINFMVQKPADLAFMFQDCTAKAVVTQRDFLPALRAAAPPLATLRAFSTTPRELSDMPMAATQGKTHPIAASGTAARL